jgi:septum formation topological specificity factor MinE
LKMKKRIVFIIQKYVQDTQSIVQSRQSKYDIR